MQKIELTLTKMEDELVQDRLFVDINTTRPNLQVTFSCSIFAFLWWALYNHKPVERPLTKPWCKHASIDKARRRGDVVMQGHLRPSGLTRRGAFSAHPSMMVNSFLRAITVLQAVSVCITEFLLFTISICWSSRPEGNVNLLMLEVQSCSDWTILSR